MIILVRLDQNLGRVARLQFYELSFLKSSLEPIGSTILVRAVGFWFKCTEQQSVCGTASKVISDISNPQTMHFLAD